MAATPCFLLNHTFDPRQEISGQRVPNFGFLPPSIARGPGTPGSEWCPKLEYMDVHFLETQLLASHNFQTFNHQRDHESFFSLALLTCAH